MLPFASSALVVALLLPKLAAQMTVAEAMADLERPARAAGACEVLLRAGGAAVPPLRALLQQPVEGAGAVDVATRMAALYVLGRLGRDAVSALPEVSEIFRERGAAGLRRQALWTLGELALASGDV